MSNAWGLPGEGGMLKLRFDRYIKRQGARNIMNEAPAYFQRKIEEKLNQKKPLAVSLLTTCCIYPATWNPRENSLAVYPWRILGYPEEFCGNWSPPPKSSIPFLPFPLKKSSIFIAITYPKQFHGSSIRWSGVGEVLRVQVYLKIIIPWAWMGSGLLTQRPWGQEE